MWRLRDAATLEHPSCDAARKPSREPLILGGFWNAQKKGCREQSSPILLHRTHNLKLGERHTAGVCYLTRPLTNLLSVFRTITTTAPFPRRRATPRAAAGCTTQMPSAPT